MILLLSLSGLGLVALPTALRRPGRRLPPRQWAVLCMLALSVGAALVIGSALMMAAPLGLAVGDLPVIVRACLRMIDRLRPGGPVASVVAGTLVVVSSVPAVRALRQARRCLQAARASARSGMVDGSHESFEIITLTDDRTFALGVPNTRNGGQMLVSSGLVEALSGREFEMVCAHEAAHLRHHHRRWLLAAMVIEKSFWFWPPVKASADTLRLALECWADDAAAGDRVEPRVRLRNALLAVAGVPQDLALAGFSSVDGLLVRVDTLADPPRRAHVGWWLVVLFPGIVLGSAIALVSSELGRQAYCLTMSGGCVPH